MKFYEILPFVIQQNKKIRHRSWGNHRYIKWEKNSSSFIDEADNEYPFSHDLLKSEGWEIYKKSIKVADFFIPSKYNETNESGEIVKLYRIETLPVGIETKNAVMVPGSEREI